MSVGKTGGKRDPRVWLVTPRVKKKKKTRGRGEGRETKTGEF